MLVLAVIVCAGMAPADVGARFTVTAMVCVALEPCPSSAVTVIVAVPPATGVIVTVAPDTPTVALLVAAELAV